MPTVNFGKVEDQKEFEPIPIGKYACVLAVDNVQRDTQGNPVTDIDNKPLLRHTKAGDESWFIKATILDGKHTGRWIQDNLSFGEKALKRVKAVFKRLGIIEGDESHDCSPDELDGSYMWVEVDRLEAATNRDGTPKVRKDGKPMLNPKVAFVGYTAMDAKEAKRYRESYQAWEYRKQAAAGDNGNGAEEADSEVPF